TSGATAYPATNKTKTIVTNLLGIRKKRKSVQQAHSVTHNKIKSINERIIFSKTTKNYEASVSTIVWKKATMSSPIKKTTVIIVTEIPAAIKPYSMAVAPSS